MMRYNDEENSEGEDLPEITPDDGIIIRQTHEDIGKLIVNVHKEISILDIKDKNKRGELCSRLVDLHLAQGNRELAEGYAELATKLGDGISAWYNYGTHFSKYGKTHSDFEEVISGYTKLAELDPAKGNFLLGVLFEEIGSRSYAIKHYVKSSISKVGNLDFVKQSKIRLEILFRKD